MVWLVVSLAGRRLRVWLGGWVEVKLRVVFVVVVVVGVGVVVVVMVVAVKDEWYCRWLYAMRACCRKGCLEWKMVWMNCGMNDCKRTKDRKLLYKYPISPGSRLSKF